MRTFITLFFVIIWFVHLALGVGAGYAALRLWHGRHHPLIKWVGLYMNAFIIDVLSAVVLLFMAKGVVFTWKFATVMFVSTFLADIVRAPLILYLIRGPSDMPPLPADPANSGQMPPQFWIDESRKSLGEIRKIVREEVAAASGTTTVTVVGPSATTTEIAEKADTAVQKEK